MKIQIFISIIFFLPIASSGNTGTRIAGEKFPTAQIQSTKEDSIQITTSFSILKDLAEKIAPSHFKISTLIDVDQDAHTYQAKPSDIKLIKNSSLFILNGYDFEIWAQKLLKANKFSGKTLIASTGVKPLQVTATDHTDHHHHHHSHFDPHAWQDPENIKIYIQQIQKAFIQLSPADKPEIQKRSTDFLNLVLEKHREMKSKFLALPKEKRKIITTHDAFQYYGKAYDISFSAAQGFSTESEPTAKSIAKLIQQIKKENIKCLFLETTSNPKLLEQIQSETSAKIGGTLLADSLSSTKASTYLEMMEFNFQQIYSCLSK
ncbi:MAG: metal ABC transporter solute-binding protein, Zn/Mn family [Pseudobdellovibrionaceae bacterium]